MMIEIAELELHPVDFQEEFPPDAIDLGADVRQAVGAQNQRARPTG